jgi:uncharacterized protein YggE
MKPFLILLLATTTFNQFVSSQIRIENYKMNEIDNWNSQIRLNNRDLQQFQAGVLNTNELTMDVKVVLNVEATSYAAIFSVRQVAETALEVNTLLNERVNAFKLRLVDMGVSKKQIVVEIISQVPIYGIEREKKLFSKSLAEVPIGFELHKNIIIIYKEYDLLNDIVFEASKNEIYDLIKVDYFADNPQSYFDTMRHAATSYLSVIQNKYQGAGFDLDSFTKVMAENTGTVYPISRYHKYQGLSRLSYKQLLKKAGSTVTMEPIVSPTLYYNHLPFSTFDIVINSRISKPSIQYTFNLQVRYSRIPKSIVKIEKTVEKQFFFITEQGDVKFIDMK